MSPPVFQLVVQAADDSSETTHARLAEVLSTFWGVSKLEVESALMLGGVSFGYASCTADLQSSLKALQAAGGKVSIVRRAINSNHSRPCALTSQLQTSDLNAFFKDYLDSLTNVLNGLNMQDLQDLVTALLHAREKNRQIFIMGNGGSAANASHLVNDLAKLRGPLEKSCFRVTSLNDQTAWLTAAANDYGYDQVFVKQLENHLNSGDLVIAISSSGNSANVIEAVNFANSREAETWAVVGFDGGQLQQIASRHIHIPSVKGQYGLMEDATAIIGHGISLFLAEYDLRQAEEPNLPAAEPESKPQPF